MVDVINISAEDNRNIIDDDAVPTLTLGNTNASGTALRLDASTSGAVGIDLNVTGTGTGIDLDGGGVGLDVDVTGTSDGINVSSGGKGAVIQSTATETHCLDVLHSTAIASATVAPLKVTTSVASGVVFEFNSPLISTASLSVIAGGFPVRMTGEDKVVYLVGYEVT